MGLLDTLANILTREPKAKPEYGPMSDALAEQAKGYGVTGGLLRNTPGVRSLVTEPAISAYENFSNIAGYLGDKSKYAELTMLDNGELVRVNPNDTRPLPPTSDSVAQLATDIGMAGLGTSFATGGVPKGAIGIFAGPNAKTANLVALKEAENLAARGADNEAIRQATGWFQGMDGKWRFEIPDNSAEFKTKISKSRGFNVPFDDWRGPSGTRGELGQALTHAALYDAYPDLANVYIDTPFGVTAQKSPSGQYYQKQTFFPEKIEVNSKIMSDKQKAMEALLHEVEHAVQAREGFTPGGNIRGMSMKDYQNLAGEIEARDVSARMNLTPEQRMATPPDLRSDAIVRYGNGPQMSVPGYVEDAAERQKNFERWFGDSKVVDADGKPLVVYHGTTAGEFEAFRPNYRKGEDFGFGVHLTPDRSFAEHYATGDAARKGKQPHVFEAYLSARNVLDVDQLVREGDPLFDLAKRTAGKKFISMKDENGVLAASLRAAINSADGKKAERLLREAGYDGIKYNAEIKGMLGGGYYTKVAEAPSYVVFDPTQIKSVFNRGTYDPKDPNILRALVPAAAAYGMSEILPYD